MTQITVSLNGEKRDLPAGTTLSGLLEILELNPGKVGVELNRVILPRSQYETTEIKPDDSLEIVQFVGGG